MNKKYTNLLLQCLGLLTQKRKLYGSKTPVKYHMYYFNVNFSRLAYGESQICLPTITRVKIAKIIVRPPKNEQQGPRPVRCTDHYLRHVTNLPIVILVYAAIA